MIDIEPILVYLAEPIDQIPSGVGKDSARDYLSQGLALRESLRMAGDFNLFQPRDGWSAPYADPRVDALNRHVLYQADCIMAWLPTGIPSIGVPSEIEAATARGIPAVVLTYEMSNTLAANRLVTVIDHPSSAAEAIRRTVRDNPRADQQALRLVIREGMVHPVRAYADDAGLDLHTAIGVTIEPGQYADVHTQVVAMELPKGYWGLVTGRSSTVRQRRLHIPNGVIDPGWRGSLFVGAYNLSDEPVTIKVGDRIGQLILIPNHPASILAVEAVGEHERGINGFGSSGD